MKYYLIPTRMAIVVKIKREITNVSKDVEKLEPVYMAGKDVKWFSQWGKQFGSSSERYI